MTKERIRVYHSLMDESEKWAEETRALLRKSGVLMVNLIGSPGCGKTTLLEHTVKKLGDRVRFAVLEGDPQTTRDAERLDVLDVQVSQIVTDGACHLGARIIYNAVADLPLEELEIVIVENVGNLVCPAEFDIGEDAKIAVLGITEGEDKPLKYPLLFQEAQAAVLTKTDLLPYVPFDLEKCLGYIRQVSGRMPVFQVSALKDEGTDEWVEWLVSRRRV